ncbi:cell surface protein SprA [Ancylomarina sp. 16SWW S1-10-2]|uniref:T9SS outer membrane translocon Sov/SprA n=1 Tax=Ancylomarina sp. 16SWW S1-10-2 TaxID=2499681 RepID=UPI0012ADE845|nr:cell surface protein SprA [Ancylomarina sp. 16SWW S1-10-2]MRT92337.1 cell surface protein SprA [Ancylomarina sp. 16SWW S1-10-2]
MKKLIRYILSFLLVIGFSFHDSSLKADTCLFEVMQQDSTLVKSEKRISNPKSPFIKANKKSAKDETLPYAFDDEDDSKLKSDRVNSPLYLKDPSNIVKTIVYDPVTGEYILKKQIGGMDYRNSTSMSKKEFQEQQNQDDLRNYWMERVLSDRNVRGTDQRSFLGSKVFGKLFENLDISFKPQGAAELSFGISTTKVDNPTISEDLRKTTSFDFNEKIQMSVSGKVGDILSMEVNYNTEATFDFENQMKLEYNGKEDNIIRKIEAGNVSMPISNTLITGGQNLFGVKAELQFGKLSVASVFSQQKGETKVVNMENGAQKSEFEVSADQYEANRHFFLSKYFYDHYDEALANLPIVNSAVTINKIEVWITNKNSNFENSRNFVGFVDLGENQANIHNTALFSETEAGVYPSNTRNNVYDQMTTTYGNIRDINQVTTTLSPLAPNFSSGKDYEKVENARLLSESEYTLNSRLGFISLNQSLNADEVVAVAYQYTANGEVYQVGELLGTSLSAPNSLILKLIKGTNLNPTLPTWELMMKNIYNIGAYQVNSEDFRLDVLYQNDQAGSQLNYIDTDGSGKNEILLSLLNLDNLNSQLDPTPDGQFDFIEALTIYSQKGRIIFPAKEPFGSYLRSKITNNALADEYAFDELYSETQNEAQQIAEKNKYSLKGSYKSTGGSEISLNALNVQPGSVDVTAGGIKLVENIDYTVDYTLGRVKIINQALLESGTPISISSESNSLFNIQTKTLLGVQMDYQFNDDFNLGATVMHLSEQPLTQKVNIGNEPISNTIWGLNGSYRTESMFLTNLVDKLPFIETKEPSQISIEGEFAQLLPGHNKAIGSSGTAYIDDFEGTETSIDMKNYNAWVLASTPQDNPEEFPEGLLNNDLAYGYNRAKLAWYIIDPLFNRGTSTTPSHIRSDKEQLSNHFVREIYEEEIWPNKETETGVPTNISVLNLAYYPDEKGPYNYDVDGQAGISDGMNADGTLKNPESRWGGIMRKIETNDFEAANIAYVEFWLMDPFVYDQTHKGGDIVLDLGNISEDVLRDSRKSFENGLPTSSNVVLVDTTVWGRVPLVQSLVNAFDNDNESRKYQDVGMDGLSTDDERTFFDKYLLDIQNSPDLGSGSQAYADANNDPSSDNFHYFRGSDYDANEFSILDRYKDFNGPDGNSPTTDLSPESYPTSATTIPDVEDLNHDNTLSETESYYEYKVHLEPNEMQVGKNFIVNKVESTVDLANGTKGTVNWFQFKVPLEKYNDKSDNINDFTSIRFMRMMLENFDEEVILRFASLDLVRNDWRTYDQSLRLDESLSPEDTKFEISAVNIEENAEKEPVNYVLPPGIDRVVDPSNPQLLQLNEQAIQLKVTDLEEGDAKAAYKTLNMDIRKYGTLKMDVHAENIDGLTLNDDDDLSVFIRIGSDYQNNYYEYEIPLKMTPFGSYTNESSDDRLIVWPDENRFDFKLDLFSGIKQMRNTEMREAGSTADLLTVYSRNVNELDSNAEAVAENNKISIKGNPNLANVRTVMVGIKYPQEGDNGNDGERRAVEVWLNELRLTDFDEDGGWAANLRVTTKLADLGTLTWAGSRMTSGFGGIEDGVNDRNKEDVFQYDFTANLELGKFFPENSGVRIPLYYAISEETSNPEYNPLDPDIPLDVALDQAANKNERDSIKHIAQDYTKRKSFNLTNVRIEKQDGKSKLLDISNLSATYSYNETYSRNVNKVRDLEKNVRGVLNYTYSSRPKNYSPLKKSKLFKSPYLQLLRDFNFYLMPTQVSVRSDIQRYYREVETRNIEEPNLLITPTYDKNFNWYRYYDLKYNLTKNLKFDFSATNTSRIDEPDGIVDKDRDRDAYNIWKDSIWNNLMDGGRNVKYHHNFNVTYKVPINKIPFLKWTSLTTRYTGSYDWNAGAILEDETLDHGNTVQNSNNIQLNGQMNMVNLYNSSNFLKKINQKYSGTRRYKTRSDKFEKVTYEGEVDEFKANVGKSVYHKLGTRDVTVKVYDLEGKEVRVEYRALSGNRVRVISKKSLKNARVRISGKVLEKDNILVKAGEGLLRLGMSVRNISLGYSETNSTTLPGYLPQTNFFGGESFNGSKAPGFNFLVGAQNKGFAADAARRGWITTDPTLNSPYVMTHTENFTFRSTIELVKGLKINLNANRTYSKNTNEFYIYNEDASTLDQPVFDAKNKTLTGNFSMTFMSMKSAFFSIGNTGDYSSKYFDEFLTTRKLESLRLAKKRWGLDYDDHESSSEEGYYEGYGSTSQDVLIPAFLKAYGGGGSKYNKLFPNITKMMPNWRVTFDGLSKIPLVKRYFKSINVNHSYTSTYNIGSYNNNLDYSSDEYGFSDKFDLIGDFLPIYEANSVSINEQFNPLINIDMMWKNNFSTTFEIKRTRNLILSLSNTQLTEVASSEFVFGMGYRFDNLGLIIGSGSGQKKFNSSLNLRGDLSIRKNSTIIRKIVDEVDQLTSGQKVVTIKMSADYVLSNRLNLRLYYDRIVNEPYVSLSYPTTTTEFGVSVRFTLAQ